MFLITNPQNLLHANESTILIVKLVFIPCVVKFEMDGVIKSIFILFLCEIAALRSLATP